ncbi:hypothetical protein OG800_49325 (plasmid) [Streptomyces sp. NBC_00445]|uniref:hypothetical protein n=1 Tax=Streptomyces sp. NBC_00445 TaxID=2975745 RepID=UPI002E1D7ED8
MSGTKSFTTQAGSVYSYSVETGEHGETIYNLSRVFQKGPLAIGAVVVHPDFNLDPAMPGLLNVQFGKGCDDRHERTDVPMLGTEHAPFVVGHQLVNPADLEVDPEAEKPVTDPVLNFTRSVRGAVTATGSHSFRAETETFERVRDLVTALVKVYRADKTTAKRETQYAKYLNAQRAEKIQPELDAANAKISTLEIVRAELLEKLAKYTA